jgi:hypothetical protein
LLLKVQLRVYLQAVESEFGGGMNAG